MCAAPFYGGQYARVLRLAPALARHGIESSLLCANSSRLALAGRERELRVEEVPPLPWFDPRSVAKILRALGRLAPDVVHIHDDAGMEAAALASRLTGRAVVRTYGEDGARRLAGHAIATTDPVARAVGERFRADRVHVVPDSVDPEAYVARVPREVARGAEVTEPDEFVFLTLAPLEPDRGHDVLLFALARLAESGMRPMLWMAGDGPCLIELDRLRRELGLAGNTRFLGRRSHVADLIHAADAVVYPSVAPHSGVGVLEAMAMERPVIATDMGGAARSVVDGETGFLVPPSDTFALAEAMRTLFVDTELARRIGAAGPARVADGFTLDDAARAHAAVYDAALGRTPA